MMTLAEMVYKYDPAQPRDTEGRWSGAGLPRQAGGGGRYQLNEFYQIEDSVTGQVTHSFGSDLYAQQALRDIQQLTSNEIPSHLIKKPSGKLTRRVRWGGNISIIEDYEMIGNVVGRKFVHRWVVSNDGRRFSFYEPAENVLLVKDMAASLSFQSARAVLIGQAMKGRDE